MLECMFMNWMNNCVLLWASQPVRRRTNQMPRFLLWLLPALSHQRNTGPQWQMHKNFSLLPNIRLLLRQFALPRKSLSSKSWQSILSQKMSTSSNSTPTQSLLSDLTTPGSSSSSSSILATPAVEEELADTLQNVTIEAPPPKPSPRYADVCYFLSFTHFPPPRRLLVFFYCPPPKNQTIGSYIFTNYIDWNKPHRPNLFRDLPRQKMPRPGPRSRPQPRAHSQLSQNDSNRLRPVRIRKSNTLGRYPPRNPLRYRRRTPMQCPKFHHPPYRPIFFTLFPLPTRPRRQSSRNMCSVWWNRTRLRPTFPLPEGYPTPIFRRSISPCDGVAIAFILTFAGGKWRFWRLVEEIFG